MAGHARLHRSIGEGLGGRGGGGGHHIPVCLGPMPPQRLGPVRPVKPPLTRTVGLETAVLLPLAGHTPPIEAADSPALVCAHPLSHTVRVSYGRSFWSLWPVPPECMRHPIHVRRRNAKSQILLQAYPCHILHILQYARPASHQICE